MPSLSDINHWHREKQRWFHIALKLRRSPLPVIWPRVLLSSLFGFGIAAAKAAQWPVTLPIESSIVPSLVLGLLLVFRTNTAYERFWEGRKQWGMLVNTVRNLARQIWVAVAEEHPRDRQAKIAALRLLVAFAVATKLHLRAEEVNEELATLMPPDWWQKLKTMHNPPLEVAFWIGDYLQRQQQRQSLNPYQLTASFQLLDEMVNVLGACERILKTPIPLAYSIHLKHMLLIYCLSLPLQLVDTFGWWTGAIAGLVSFTLFGIEAIALAIENPFTYDVNALPLDDICQTMQINIEDLITLAPSLRHWQALQPSQG